MLPGRGESPLEAIFSATVRTRLRDTRRYGPGQVAPALWQFIARNIREQRGRVPRVSRNWIGNTGIRAGISKPPIDILRESNSRHRKSLKSRSLWNRDIRIRAGGILVGKRRCSGL